MDITKTNFRSTLPEVKAAISGADFLSIDCEFTGLSSGINVNAFDTPKQYYEKINKGSGHFLVIQVGICAFRYDNHAKAFKHQTFNFYIFPRQSLPQVPDRMFMCQASSIDFLIGQNFDFNKLFKEGISYINKPDEEKIREELLERQKIRENNINTPSNSTNKGIQIPAEDQEFVDQTLKNIEGFLEGDEDEYVLPVCSAFYRRLIYQTAGEKFGSAATLETRILENKERTIVVTKLGSEEQSRARLKNKFKEELMELEDAVGFSAVVQHISQSGKLIVGHNMLLDVAHIINKFMTPIPAQYEEFKECLHCLFPKIIDTKFMSHSEHFRTTIKSSVLGQMLETLMKSPFELPKIEPENASASYGLDIKKEHEAGYDAYITGVCFLGMAQFIEKAEHLKDFTFKDTTILIPFLNKLFLMKIQDHPYINITGKDVVPNRDHVLHITFPRKWKHNEISQLFSPFGSVHIAWINDTSAYVSLFKRDQAALALSTLSQSDTYSVISYARHQSLNTTNLPVAPSPTLVARKKREPENMVTIESRKRRRVTSFGDILKDYCRKTNGKLMNKEGKSRIIVS